MTSTMATTANYCVEKSFVQHRDAVRQVVVERYLHTNVACQLCPTCVTSISAAPSLLHFATAAALEAATDLLTQFSSIVILETVLNAIKADKKTHLYHLLLRLLRENPAFVYFPNEHFVPTFDATTTSPLVKIARAIEWYHTHLPATSVVLLVAENEPLSALGAGTTLENDSNDKDKAFRSVPKNKDDCQSTRNFSIIGIQDHIVTSFGSAALDQCAILSSERHERLTRVYAPHLTDAMVATRLANKTVFASVLRITRDHFLEAHVLLQGHCLMEHDSSTLSEDNPPHRTSSSEVISVRVSGYEHMNRSMEGDTVVIEILPRSEWTDASTSFATAEDTPDLDNAAEGGESTSVPPPARSNTPCGRVVAIQKRKWRHYCGSFQADSTALFLPMSRKCPKIKLKSSQAATLQDKRFVVAIDSWPETSRYPLGHYVKTLGVIGDKDTETQVLLLEHDIPTSAFSPAVLACLPPEAWCITPDNSVGRTDLRALHVMSIDPPGCKDIDDALHVMTLPNGNLQLGVHIADVTHFVAAGNVLDLEAMDRGTSTYLVDQRLDMLPSLLTTQLCSLRDSEDHFAFSVIWEISPPGVASAGDKDEECAIQNVSFCKSIIRSKASLSYQAAQEQLDVYERKIGTSKSSNSKKGKGNHKDLEKKEVQGWSLSTLSAISKVLKSRRVAAGALSLASTEVSFDASSTNASTSSGDGPLDKDAPSRVKVYTTYSTNGLVEEMMLLANITVAKQILSYFPSLALLRRHPAPRASQFEALAALAATLGLEFDATSSKALADSLEAASQLEDPMVTRMLRILTTRCMTPAAYFCAGEIANAADYHHYGLAAPLYTHFTSPIRRYSDVVVHRLLAASIGVAPLPPHLDTRGKLHDCADNLNARHLNAQLANRASVALHTLLYFKANPIENVDAVVTGVKQNGLRVMVPAFGIDATLVLVPKNTVDASTVLTLDAIAQRLSPVSRPDLSLGFLDKIRINIHVTTVLKRSELVLELVSPVAFLTAVMAGLGGSSASSPKEEVDKLEADATLTPLKKQRLI